MARACWIVGLVATMLVSTGAGRAQSPDDDPEATFRADLVRVSEEAAAAYDRGNEARRAAHHEDALAAYRQAATLAPAVPHPRRRACAMLRLLDRLDDALHECEAAVAMAPTAPHGQIALAALLIERKQPGDLRRALQLAREASERVPDNADAREVLCLALGEAKDAPGFSACVDRLLAMDPSGLSGNYLGTLAAASSGDYALARTRLARANAAGLDAAQGQSLAAMLDRAERTAVRPADVPPRANRRSGWTSPGVIATVLIALVLSAIVLVIGRTISRRKRRRTLTEPRETTADG
jgi:tetratricopeptide (TPR) repeat protein